MTAQELRQEVLDTARSWIGDNEKDKSFQHIINRYNNLANPLPRGYRVKYTDEWCATFVSAVALVNGTESIIPPECSCNEMIKLFQKLGRWQEDECIMPSPGDIIFYDWQDSGRGDNKGSADHVGIVVSLDPKTRSIIVIEGNKGEAVAYREVPVNGRYIRGYGCPDYAALATKEQVPPAQPTLPVTPTMPKIEEETMKVYKSFEEVPVWAKPVVEKAMRTQSKWNTTQSILNGTGEGDLNLTDETLRTLQLLANCGVL